MISGDTIPNFFFLRATSALLRVMNWADDELEALTSLIEEKQFDRVHVVLSRLQESELPGDIEFQVGMLVEKLQQDEAEEKR